MLNDMIARVRSLRYGRPVLTQAGKSPFRCFEMRILVFFLHALHPPSLFLSPLLEPSAVEFNHAEKALDLAHMCLLAQSNIPLLLMESTNLRAELLLSNKKSRLNISIRIGVSMKNTHRRIHRH